MVPEGTGPGKPAGALAFDHVVVSGLHLLFGIWLGAAVSYGELGQNFALAVAGNLVGGLLLMTLTHTVQAKSSPGSD